MSTVNRALGVSIALILVAALIPSALLAIASAPTSGWSESVKTIFQTVLPILAVVGLLYLFMSGVGRRGSFAGSRIIQIAVALFIVAAVVPLSITNIMNMPTATTVTSGTQTITYTIPPAVVTLTQSLLPILAILSIALAFFVVRGRR